MRIIYWQIDDYSFIYVLNINVSFVLATGLIVYSASRQTVTFDRLAAPDAGNLVKFTVTVKGASDGDVICSTTLTYAEFNLSVTAEEGMTIYAP